MRIEELKKGLFVSCQALEDDPLYGCMGKMAVAAELGGAVGVRINTIKDIKEVKEVVTIPIIGIIKKRYPNCNAYITPTLTEVEDVAEAGAEIVAIDATSYMKPDGKTTYEFIRDIKEQFDILVMADISSYEDGINAWEAGADILATTLSSTKANTGGQPPTTEERVTKTPDFDLIKRLVNKVSIPVFGEGGFWNEVDTVKAFELGAHSVVIGSAITRPQVTTKKITSEIDNFLKFGRNL